MGLAEHISQSGAELVPTRLRVSGSLACLVLVLLVAVATSPSASSLPSAEGHISAGLRLYEQGNLKAAAAELRKGINLKPDALDAHYHLGRISLIEKDYLAAFESLKEVLAIQRTYKDARELFEKLRGPLEDRLRLELKVKPRSARAHNVLGFLRLHENRIDEGITHLRYAVRFDPSLAAAYDDLAWAYYQLQRFPEALKFSERAFTLDPVRASITKHYQQLFYLKKLGFASGEADPDQFYGGPAAAAPEQARPRPAASGAATSAGPRSPAELPELDLPPLDGGLDESELTPDAAVPPRPPARPPAVAKPPRLDGSVDASVDLTAIQIDDSAIVGAFLKNFKPPTPAVDPDVPATAPAAPTERRDAPPSSAQIAAKVRGLYTKGRDLAAKNDFEGAQAAFELLAQIDPSYRDTMQQLEKMRRYARTKKSFDAAMDYYQTGAFAQSLELLRGIDLKTLSEFRKVPTLDHLTGECYFRTGKYELAEQKLSRYCVGHPDDVKFRYLLAKSYAELGKPHEALDQLSIIRQVDSSFLGQFPDSGGFRMKLVIRAYFPIVAGLALIWLLMSLGYVGYKFKQAAEARRLKETLNTAQQAHKEEDWQKMLEACEAYEKRGRKRDVRVGQSKALALVQLGRVDQARDELEKLPDDPKRQLLKAKLMLETGESSSEALVEYSALLAAEPNNLRLLQVMSQILQQQEPYGEEAERLLQRLTELEPMKLEYLFQLADLHLSRERYDGEARKVFQKLLSEDGSNVRARIGLARCHFAASQFVEAIREAKQVVDAELENPAVHEVLVESYRQLDMIEEGTREYRRLLSAHPGAPLVEQGLARLQEPGTAGAAPISDGELKAAYEKGARLFAEGRFAEAVTPLSAAFDGNYQRTCAGALMVRAYLRMNETEMALRVFERMDVFDQPPDEFLLALCYEMAGIYEGERNPREAMRLYNFICRSNVSYRDAFQKLEALQARV